MYRNKSGHKLAYRRLGYSTTTLTIGLIAIAFGSGTIRAQDQDTLVIRDDIEVGYHQTIDNVAQAQQGIAAYDNFFYTSGGAAAQEEWLFRYAPSWGKDNEVEYQRVYFDDGLNGVTITHVGDIAGYTIRLYGVFSDSIYLDAKDAEKIYIAWFDRYTLDQGTGDYVDVSRLVSLFPDLDDVSGLAFRDDLLYLLGYYTDDSDRPRIFSFSMDGLRPNVLSNVYENVYEIDTKFANGLAFKDNYIFISRGPGGLGPATAYIDIYEYPLSEQEKAFPIKTYEYEGRYTHAEGITFNEDELWVAQGTHVLQLDSIGICI
ncbi:MAG: hypothetical protein A2Z25_21335 [Planctomycetes bacterium RBG_16_55_9]|nr:MAG: hypothetical protein A2Z25_21335 [Planctomycetes bacterium RBG_16_55_9]